jgi:YspA, cpYpsA-related SLOG family
MHTIQMRPLFRLLVTGSRTWDDPRSIEQALTVILARHPGGVVLVHGACPHGADAIAAAYAARTPGYQIEAHPADWHRYGRAAGHRRNAVMITLGAGGCVAFIRAASPGSTATVRLAKAAGIPIWLHARP